MTTPLDSFYQGLLVSDSSDTAKNDTTTPYTLADMLRPSCSETSSSHQLQITDIQDVKSSETETPNEVQQDKHSDTIQKIKESFKDTIAEFNENKQHIIDLENAKLSMRTLKSNIGNEIRLMQNLLNMYVQEKDTKTKLDDMYNNIANDLDIYSCTGIMDIEKRIEDLNNATSKLKHELQKGVDIFQCMSLVNGVRPCPICLNAEVKVFCVPCGHTFCESCVKNIKRCYMCRNIVQSVNRLYFT